MQRGAASLLLDVCIITWWQERGQATQDRWFTLMKPLWCVGNSFGSWQPSPRGCRKGKKSEKGSKILKKMKHHGVIDGVSDGSGLRCDPRFDWEWKLCDDDRAAVNLRDLGYIWTPGLAFTATLPAAFLTFQCRYTSTSILSVFIKLRRSKSSRLMDGFLTLVAAADETVLTQGPLMLLST